MIDIYDIEMAPFAKARPRVTKRGKHTYMPPNYVKRKEKLQWLFKEAGGELNMDGYFKISVTFRFMMPKSWSKKKRGEKLGRYCGKKPDIDNCIGEVMDALFENDSKVIDISASKVWSEQDSIFLTITKMKD
jgi:Holliday junction resolvase RusA-like endonuclease